MRASLDLKQAALLAALWEVIPDTEIEKDALRVTVGGRGHELGRDYLRLLYAGLVQERRIRPGFLRRLMGGQPTVLVRLTEAGQGLAAELSTEDGAQPDAVRSGAGAASAAPRVVVPQVLPEEEELPQSTADRLDGLAELIGLMGFALTAAGRSLAVSRWADMRPDGEVALEIVVTCIAHAARGGAGPRLHPRRTMLLIEDIERVFAGLVAEGALAAPEMDLALRRMREFVALGDADADLHDYLSDPVRGLVTPATAPEHVFRRIPGQTGE